MRYQPLSTAAGPELDPRAGDADASIHVPTSASFYQAAIEGLTLLDEQILEQSPDFPRLYDTDVRYRKEKRDTWRHADDVLCSGWGDCEDLAAWRAAELRVSGEDPDAYVYVYKSGPHRFHAVVALGDGTIEDPSLILGMHVSAARRAKMPRVVGQGENVPDTVRQFGACPMASGAGDLNNVLGADETIGQIGRSLFDHRAAPGGHKCNMHCPHFAAQWRDAVRGTLQGYADEAAGPGQDEDYPDDGTGPSPDEDQPPDDQQPEEVQAGPRGPSKAKRFFSAVAQPFKYAAAPLTYGAKFGMQALRTGADVSRGLSKAAMLPLKGLSKVFSIFGNEPANLEPLRSPSPYLLGSEEDDEYEEGDEDAYSDEEFQQAEPEDLDEMIDQSPSSQRIRFETAEVSPGVWGGLVKIPSGQEPGKMITMYTSPAPSEEEAAKRMENLAMRAANTPALQMVVSPQALITMAAMRLGKPGTLSNVAKTLGRFVRFAG